MNTLPDELLSEVIRCATDVPGELDSNSDDRFRVPSQHDMEEMVKAAIPTRRALVQVSRRLCIWATPALYRSVIVTHPHTINLLFVSIMECGERSILFRPGVRRVHLSIPYEHRECWRDVAPGAEELMKHLPNLKIFCARAWLHPIRSLLFSPLDPATSFPHLEAIEYSNGYNLSTIRESISNLLLSSPNLRVFLLHWYERDSPNPGVCAFKYLRGCYIDALINTSPSDSSIGTNLEDTKKQILSSQTPFPRLRSLHFWGSEYPKINRNLIHHITLLDLSYFRSGDRDDVLDLSQFAQLRTFVIHPFPRWWKFKISGDNAELREVGIRSERYPPRPVLARDFQAVVELVMGLPVTIERLRLLGFGLCRAVARLELHRGELLRWRTRLEERSITLEGPDGLPLVEFLSSLSP
jgi:hypothetical protein